MTTPDYSLIWAANSPLSPYTFSDANYLTGWNFIGPVPPDRRMFDAWMKRCDEKEKWLYDNTAKQSDLEDLKQYVQANGGVPVGTIIAHAGNNDVDGFLLCDGSPVSRTTYKDLWEVIGTTYGGGDGSTTFNVPNLTGLFLQGAGTAGTNVAAGLPNIKGNKDYVVTRGGGHGGAISATSQGGAYIQIEGANYMQYNVRFDASLSNSIYGASDTVQPPAMTVRYLIKATGGSTSGGTATDSEVSNMLDGVFG